MANKAIHDTILSLKNIKKGDIVKKCPGSLYYPLLVSSKYNKKYKNGLQWTGKFLIFIMIILEWYLILNTNQFMEKASKY